MLAKQPASLGGFEFDAIIKRSETMTCDVPEYATEEGYSITDNICLKPRELEIEAIITNSPVTWAEQHAASSSRVETMVEELRQLWLKKTPVSFTAAGDSYENMCITSITAPRTVEDGSSTRLTIKLKQASINSTDMANISVKYIRGGTSKKNTGAGQKKLIVYIWHPEGRKGHKIQHFVFWRKSHWPFQVRCANGILRDFRAGSQ